MSRKQILSVDCEIPGGFSEFVAFDSDTSLLDGDIILFNPSITEFRFRYESKYKGNPALTDDASFQLRQRCEHWRKEIEDAVKAGKTVVVFLPELEEVYIDTGDRQYSGTGRNRQTTRIVKEYNNYRAIPLEFRPVNSKGQSMKLTKDGLIISGYWKNFEQYSSYKVRLDGDFGNPLIVTKTGDSVVGSIVRSRETSGAIILLPYLSLWSADFSEDVVVEKQSEGEENQEDSENEEVEFRWTELGIQFGHRLRQAIIEIDKALKHASDVTPTPAWVLSEKYVLPKEKPLRSDLLKVEAQLEKLHLKKQEIKQQLSDEGLLRHLLYEQGKLLEKAILHALRLLGFKATPYQDGDSEFDVVFDSAEGRMLGEAEGKDNSAINIDKLRQLEMNIHEDFARDGIDQMAKGVLFSNAYRLREIEKRENFFTVKCIAAAKRTGAALVRTTDLFGVAQYLSGTPDDNFARLCRQAFFAASGDIVDFPVIPETEDKTDYVQSSDGESE